MAVYSVWVHYDAYGEIEIEAENEDEAVEIANENLDSINFEGEYDIEQVRELKK